MKKEMVEDWLKLGYSLSESESKELDKISKINDTLNISGAGSTKSLVELMKEFDIKDDEEREILDKLNQINNS